MAVNNVGNNEYYSPFFQFSELSWIEHTLYSTSLLSYDIFMGHHTPSTLVELFLRELFSFLNGRCG